MRKILPCLIVSALASTTSFADMLGIYVGAGNWKPEFSGSAANGSTDSLEIGSDVNIDDKNQSGMYIAFEHPIPIIPNIMVTTQDMASQGSGTFTGTFGSQTFSGGVDTEFDLSHRDYTLYYEILDNWVNLDIGLTGRQFDGFVNVTETANPSNFANESLDGTLPMLYGKARFDLPFSGLSFSVIMNYISASGNTISDTSMVLGYESSFGLGIEGGIRTFNLELDDEDDFKTDLEFDGAFVNLTYHF